MFKQQNIMHIEEKKKIFEFENVAPKGIEFK